MATPYNPIKGTTMTLHPSHRSDLHACKLTITTPSYPIKGTTKKERDRDRERERQRRRDRERERERRNTQCSPEISLVDE